MAERKTIDLHEVDLSKLRKGAAGREVAINEGTDQPVELLSPPNEPLEERIPGSAKGLFEVPENFNAPLADDLQRLFDGERDEE